MAMFTYVEGQSRRFSSPFLSIRVHVFDLDLSYLPTHRNFQGQLGLGDPNAFERNERNHPYLANFSLLKGLQGQKVTQFACGGEHSAALLDSDDVYTFGSG